MILKLEWIYPAILNGTYKFVYRQFIIIFKKILILVLGLNYGCDEPRFKWKSNIFYGTCEVSALSLFEIFSSCSKHVDLLIGQFWINSPETNRQNETFIKFKLLKSFQSETIINHFFKNSLLIKSCEQCFILPEEKQIELFAIFTF